MYKGTFVTALAILGVSQLPFFRKWISLKSASSLAGSLEPGGRSSGNWLRPQPLNIQSIHILFVPVSMSLLIAYVS